MNRQHEAEALLFALAIVINALLAFELGVWDRIAPYLSALLP